LNVNETLHVDTSGNRVLVRVTVENRSERTIYVPRGVAGDKALAGPQFEVRDMSNGDPIDYSGKVVKRGPIGAADFVPVKPHGVHRHAIDITDAYAFLHGRHTYQLSYSGHYLANVAEPDRPTAIEPAPVLFSHTGR
jgi:hypothetical protein